MLDQEVVDVLFHAQATGAVRMLLRIIPFEIDSCKFLALPIGGDCVVFLQYFLKMLDMLFSDIFDSKVINDEDEHDWSPLVTPQSHCGRCFIVSSFVEAGAQEIICKFTTLRESIATADDLKVDPTIMYVVG